MNKFTYFPNHGNEKGERQWTICYGEGTGNEVIVGAENRKDDAIEACKRLNEIIKDVAIDEHKNDIYQLESNLLDVPHTKEEKAFAKCEIKNHKMRISEIKKNKIIWIVQRRFTGKEFPI